jgi:hypothetical protein
MKIRNGFVSNSSSSSFTVIMSPEQEKTWKEQLNVYEKQVVDEGVYRDEKEFNGQKVVVYSGYTGNYDCFDDMSLDLIPEDEELTEEELSDKYDCEFYVSEFWYSAEEKLPDGALQLSVDF